MKYLHISHLAVPVCHQSSVYIYMNQYASMRVLYKVECASAPARTLPNPHVVRSDRRHTYMYSFFDRNAKSCVQCTEICQYPHARRKQPHDGDSLPSPSTVLQAAVAVPACSSGVCSATVAGDHLFSGH